MPLLLGRAAVRPDATTALTVYVVLLLAVPASMRFSPLGSAGSPATVLGIVLFFWWAWSHLQGGVPLTRGHQPVRTAMLAWLLIVIVVYVHAMAFPIPSDEISTADSGLLRVLSMAGVLLTASDGLTSLDRARALARRLVLGVGIVAVLGLVQNFTGQLWVDRLVIPGLSSAPPGELVSRSGLTRVSGTSTHPIEFGVVLSMGLPLAIAFVRTSATHRWRYGLLLAAMAVAIFLSISRSAIVCAVVALVATMWTWPLREKVWGALCLLAISMLVYLTVPGVLGTVTKLFTGASEDSSVQSRTGSYDIAWHFVERSPWVGRGVGTFLPKYWILDNGYLGLFIETGVLGMVGLLAVIGTALLAALRAAAVLDAGPDRELARSLLASVSAGAAALAFFDTFGFPQSASIFFLSIGLAGGWRRLATAQRDDLRAQPVPTTRQWSPG